MSATRALFLLAAVLAAVGGVACGSGIACPGGGPADLELAGTWKAPGIDLRVSHTRDALCGVGLIRATAVRTDQGWPWTHAAFTGNVVQVGLARGHVVLFDQTVSPGAPIATADLDLVRAGNLLTMNLGYIDGAGAQHFEPYTLVKE